MAATDEIYSAKLFFSAVLPLVKHVAEGTPLGKSLAGKNGVYQVSAKTDSGEIWATHFLLENGELTVRRGVSETAPDVSLDFASLADFNAFFKGKLKLPKIHGLFKFSLFIPFIRILLKMSALLGAVKPPENQAEKALVTKLYFYLLSTGISTLNKAGHPDISAWAKSSPDRVYAWAVDGHPDIAAYIRVKAGNSKASRGSYTRSKPFFTMRFDSLDSALGTLLGTSDMMDAVVNRQLIMEGAPEFGAQFGNFMLIVGDYAK